MTKKFYITTPIYYVNDKPHIGHAYTTVAADVLARYYKSVGKEVFFLTGTDEHGAKIEEAARAANTDPEYFVDELSELFKMTWHNLDVNYDGYIRTTNPDHEVVVLEFIEKLNEAGYIDKRNYDGLYCTGCEKYLSENELVGGKCQDHNIEPVCQSEENYFFKLSKFGDRILEKINSGEIEIIPSARKNEIIGKIKQGLEDVSISREAVEWGITYPGDENQTVYVWIDALLNYYSAQKVFSENNIWPPDIQLMAKDIVWFHAVIWPALLLAADLPLPKKIVAHGFFTMDGKKMSKTLGNALDPNQLIEKFGADPVRYSLLREFPFGEDGDISEGKIAKRYKEDLGNSLGNLLNRTISMIVKYDVKIQNPNFKFQKYGIKEKAGELIESFKFDQALVEIFKVVKELNVFIDKEEPWQLEEEKKDDLERILLKPYFALFEIAEALAPFMPETADKIKFQLENLKPEPLFPRIEQF